MTARKILRIFNKDGIEDGTDPQIPIIPPLSKEEQFNLDMLEAYRNFLEEYVPTHIKSLLDKHVVGQEEAKKSLASCVYTHFKRQYMELQGSKVEVAKSNLLFIGPTGTGKTLLIRALEKELNIPVSVADATTLTEAGYAGDDVENILLPLLESAGYDEKIAGKGIVFIDEIDKVAINANTSGRDISGRGVQRQLLKMLEGTIVKVANNRNKNSAKWFDIDTKNILFICSGAFSGIEDIVARRLGKNSIGFSETPLATPELINKAIRLEDIISYGFMPELMGRISTMAILKTLTREELRRILTSTANCPLAQYKELLYYDGVTIKIDEKVFDIIIDSALSLNTGARGIKYIMDLLFRDILFEAPSQNKALVKITKEYAEERIRDDNIRP